MGFLKVFGKALKYDESKQYHQIVKDNAMDLIINVFKNQKSCAPKFGYEFEFHKIFIDHEKKKVQIDLSGQDDIINSSTYNLTEGFHLSHEYGGWMIEVVHENPFQYQNISQVIESVKDLYNYLNIKIGDNKTLSFPSFPLLGVGNYYKNDSPNTSIEEEKKEEVLKEEIKREENDSSEEDINTNPFSKSIFLNDVIINRHPRFGCLTRNIRIRRGEKVNIKVPIFKDTYTNFLPTPSEPFPGYVYMDAMGFGMGNCCLQVTLGACCIDRATYIHDQFLSITPILLALSSACPVYKGKITDFDNRFNLISEGVDDRTQEERDPNSSKYIYKSRYSPSYSYISENKYSPDYLNDTPKFPINIDYYKKLISNGLPHKLAEHFCNILVRDPLVIFDKKIKIEDKTDMTHFECINSTNWNSLRFKLPRLEDKDTCFKVEVRPCDIQITPFENTALIAFILSIYGALMTYDLNFAIPISMIDENFKRAYKKDAILKEKFYWRINGMNLINDSLKKTEFKCNCKSEENALHIENQRNLTKEEDIKLNIRELTINEILNGSSQYNYPGLIKASFMSLKDFFMTNELDKYIELLSKRGKGELMTDAHYVRNFLVNHPLYKKNSIVSEEMNYDLLNHLLKIQNGDVFPKELFGGLI